MSFKTFFQGVAVLLILLMLVIGGAYLIGESGKYIHNRSVQSCMNYDRFTLEECEFIVTVIVEGR